MPQYLGITNFDLCLATQLPTKRIGFEHFWFGLRSDISFDALNLIFLAVDCHFNRCGFLVKVSSKYSHQFNINFSLPADCKGLLGSSLLGLCLKAIS